MIQKWYEVTCDYCGAAINHYASLKPTMAELEADGVICTATKQFCDDQCYADWQHDKQTRRYTNLHPDGKIHREK